MRTLLNPQHRRTILAACLGIAACAGYLQAGCTLDTAGGLDPSNDTADGSVGGAGGEAGGGGHAGQATGGGAGTSSGCGDGVRSEVEQCDGADFGEARCEEKGLGPGELVCTPVCVIDYAACGPPPSCGNGKRDGAEECEGGDLGAATCESIGYGPGELGCLASCKYDPSGCLPPSTCGNDVREDPEPCDGADFAGKTCAVAGHDHGALQCTAQCQLDTSKCHTCGNGVIEIDEECDGTALGGESCATPGHAEGEVTCTGSCKLDYSACHTCGNGILESGEACDLAELGGATCAAAGHQHGSMSCTPQCALDSSACHSCGNGVIETGETCDGQQLGGDTCVAHGYSTGALACSSSCEIDDSSCLTYPSDWFGVTWTHRKKLTIAKEKIPGALAGFAVLVDLTDAGLQAHAQAGGQDILFTASDGKTKLAHEIELYEPATGHLVAWVKTWLDQGSDHVLYMYFGNGAAGAQHNPAAVWDGEYAGVWHLGEATVDGGTTGTHANSVQGGVAGVQGGNAQHAGQIGFSQRFDGNDRIAIGAANAFAIGNSNATISAWIISAATADSGVLVYAPQTHVAGDQLFGLNHVAKKWGHDEGWTNYLGASGDAADAAWHHVAWTQEKDVAGTDDRWRVYVDGQEQGTMTVNGKADPAGATLRVGDGLAGSFFTQRLVGQVDELRISRIARSGLWLKACHDNQRAPGTWVSASAAETGIH